MRHYLAGIMAVLVAAGSTAAAEDVWPDHALSDEDAARIARDVMPFTQEQIELIGLLLQQTRQATANAAGPQPEGRSRRLLIEPDMGMDIPELNLVRGYTTAVSFSDVTGMPWPIDAVLTDQQFLPGNDTRDDQASRHLLYLAPSRSGLSGNAIVKLEGLADPLALTLVEGTQVADFHVDIRIERQGPNADPAMLADLAYPVAGDPELLDLLSGVTPADGQRLIVDGGLHHDRAWRVGDDLLLVTHAILLSPGPWAVENSSSGRHAYRLPFVPHALVAVDGREARISFRAFEIDPDEHS